MKQTRTYVRDNVPLSRFGVLVAQLESIVASASQQAPDPLLCFDLLSDLISAIEDESKESILLCQRKCEDALYSLLVLGARRPVRHLSSIAMARIISKGDGISIFSRASSLQGFLSDGKKNDPQKVAGAAQCLGQLYHYFGRKITSGLVETTNIVTKLMKFNEEFVRQEALLMLRNALEGSGGSGPFSAYLEAFRLITRHAIGDKSFIVRIAAAKCLKAFANIGGPGLGFGELESSSALSVKALEDPISSVRNAFAESLGSLLALGMNPEAQVQPRGKGPFPPAKKLEGGLIRHLSLPFSKASGVRMKGLRFGITLSWVYFLQAIRVKYLLPDSELQNYALEVLNMLRTEDTVDTHSLACIFYILRVGMTDQMTEPSQREFLVFLGKQLEYPDISSSMRIATLRTLSYTLKTVGEVPFEFKKSCDNTVIDAVSHPCQLVRVEAALMLKILGEMDPTCVGGLISYGVTTLTALREVISFEKGSNLKVELDSLHGQAVVLGAMVSISPKLLLGYPARLPKTIFEVSKRMIEGFSRNPISDVVEKESGWLLLTSLLSSMPFQELEGIVFDILALFPAIFGGNPLNEIDNSNDLRSKIRVWSAVIEALDAFVRCFISCRVANTGILLQPVLVFLSSALDCILLLLRKRIDDVKQEVHLFMIRTLRAYQSLPDPLGYKTDHSKIIQLCTIPFRDASKCEESSCLRLLLDKRDAWLGPWTPGRDRLEDELQAFQGGKAGIMPCMWDIESSNFPLPETIDKELVNQMLLCFGIMFSSQDNSGMLLLLGVADQSFKAGKKQIWHSSNVTNICVGLLSGFKTLISSRPQPLSSTILDSSWAIFQSILVEGDICASHRRAAAEGLGLLARLGNDAFTARMLRSLLNELNMATESIYAGSISFALGCIHRSAGGMALSTLVPVTVNSISSLAKSAVPSLQLWSLHGLLLTVEAAGFSFLPHVQVTLVLAMDILLSEDTGIVDIQQAVGRLINAIVAVLGPELSPGSIFFSRCKSVIAEISSQHEAATLLESVRFTQQLVLFAPQAVSVHSHVPTLLSTLFSRQPTLRNVAISTLRHLIEKNPDSIVDERIEETLFHILDDETDSVIGNLVRAAILSLLFASSSSRPSHWIRTCKDMVLSTATGRASEAIKTMENDSRNGPENDSRLHLGEDDENMVSNYKTSAARAIGFEASNVYSSRDKCLRYRTRLFAAEILNHLPSAVGTNPAHFDLSLARIQQSSNKKASQDWLVLHLPELISLAYQISTIQLESMRPIGVLLLSTVVDKFEKSTDPDLPGHGLLEQYQAQLVSAIRTSLDSSSGPVLLEAGLQLATKVLTSGILGSDQAAIQRIFSWISRPLNGFGEIYYPSFAEWVSCKIKIRLLVAHASLKCDAYSFLQMNQTRESNEYLALLPLFARSSSSLGKYWIGVLRDYCYLCLSLVDQKHWIPSLDGIQLPLALLKIKSILDEAWPVILQALALDAVPLGDGRNLATNIDSKKTDNTISGYSMVELDLKDYQFLWGLALLVLFQQHDPRLVRQIIQLKLTQAHCGEDLPDEECSNLYVKLYEIVLPVFHFLLGEKFFEAGYLKLEICQELLQAFSCFLSNNDSWNTLSISIIVQMMQHCPNEFFEYEHFIHLALELPLSYLFNCFRWNNRNYLQSENFDSLVSQSFNVLKAIIKRVKPQNRIKYDILPLMVFGYNCLRRASTDQGFSAIVEYVNSVRLILCNEGNIGEDDFNMGAIVGSCLSAVVDLTKECLEVTNHLDKSSDASNRIERKIRFFLEETIELAKLACRIELSGEKNVHYSLFTHSANNFRAIYSNGNSKIQKIGLEVLKTVLQRSTSIEERTFLLFFTAEMLVDIFSLIQNVLQKPLGKETVVVLGECLKLFMLLQTLPRSSDSRRMFMDLLLKAIILIWSSAEKNSSKEVTDVKSIVVSVVSHLAQIPSSAANFKDALLSMPAIERQLLQGLILASVKDDRRSIEIIMPSRASEIKLPISKDPPATSALALRGPEGSIFPLPATNSNSNGDNADNDEDDEDWDAFQSFPSSGGAIGTTKPKDDGVDENSLMDLQCVDGSGEEEPSESISCSAVNDKKAGLILPSDAAPQSYVDGSGDEEEPFYSISPGEVNDQNAAGLILPRDELPQPCADGGGDLQVVAMDPILQETDGHNEAVGESILTRDS